MLTIRFFRIGKKNQPSFKIVVTDKRRPPRGGRFIEEVGFWNPLTKEKAVKGERIKHWISKGAKPSASVYNLLIKEGILEGKKIPLHKKKKTKKGEASAKVPEGEVPKAQAEAKEEKAEEKKEEKPAEEPKEAKEEKKEEPPKEEKPEEPEAEQKPEEKPKDASPEA